MNAKNTDFLNAMRGKLLALQAKGYIEKMDFTDKQMEIVGAFLADETEEQIKKGLGISSSAILDRLRYIDRRIRRFIPKIEEKAVIQYLKGEGNHPTTLIGEDREYVLISVGHSIKENCLLFCGRQTKDYENRSFSSYTTNLDECEKYSEIDLKQVYKRFWDGFTPLERLSKEGNYAVKIDDLYRFGQKHTVIWIA